MAIDLFGNDGDKNRSPVSNSASFTSERRKDPVFFALRPDADATAAATRVYSHLKAKHNLIEAPIPLDRRHITLFPVGAFEDLSQAALDVIFRVAAAQMANSFELVVDLAMSFSGKDSKKPLVLAGPKGNDKLMLFRSMFLADMKRVGLHFKGMSSFTPHMTLLYSGKTIPEQEIEPIRWTAREFVLIRSRYGRGQHDVLGTWPLLA